MFLIRRKLSKWLEQSIFYHGLSYLYDLVKYYCLTYFLSLI